jgi:hypothetical protein
MDGQTLQQLFSGSNPFLAQMGEKAFNLDQQKRQADLATTLGMEQRNQAMHPLDMESKKASTALNQSNANLNQYALSTKLPKDKALEQVMQKFHKETDDVSREQTKAQITRMMQIAAMAKANKGALPEGLNLKPEEIQQYAPANLDKLIQYGETFLRYDPTEIAARQRASEAQNLAKVRAEGQIAVKTTPGAGGGGKPTVELPKTYGEVVAGMSKYKKASERLAYLKTILPGISQELQKSLQPAYSALKVQADAEANARTANEVNISGATQGKVPVNPAVNLGDAPGAVTSRPERQAPAQVSQADIEFTAKKHGISVEEVKKRLGIK